MSSSDVDRGKVLQALPVDAADTSGTTTSLLYLSQSVESNDVEQRVERTDSVEEVIKEKHERRQRHLSLDADASEPRKEESAPEEVEASSPAHQDPVSASSPSKKEMDTTADEDRRAQYCASSPHAGRSDDAGVSARRSATPTLPAAFPAHREEETTLMAGKEREAGEARNEEDEERERSEAASAAVTSESRRTGKQRLSEPIKSSIAPWMTERHKRAIRRSLDAAAAPEAKRTRRRATIERGQSQERSSREARQEAQAIRHPRREGEQHPEASSPAHHQHSEESANQGHNQANRHAQKGSPSQERIVKGPRAA